jgi:hypothetical protein
MDRHDGVARAAVVDGGRSWTAAATPLATDQATGIFSIAFRDATHGVSSAVTTGRSPRLSTTRPSRRTAAPRGRSCATAACPGSAPSQPGCLGRQARSWRSVRAAPTGRRTKAGRGPRVEAEGFDTFSVAPGGRVAWAAARVADLEIDAALSRSYRTFQVAPA